MEIISNIIFLDTSIFENENFFRGHKIHRLGELSRDGVIQVKITEITYSEIKSRFRKRLAEAKSLLKKMDKSLDGDGKILKNLPEYAPYFPIKKVDIDVDFEILVSKLDAFIKESKIEIIDCEISSINEVFKQYWNQEPPFGEGQKKDEFPDAFAINTIHHSCKSNKKKAFVLSKDSDFTKYSDDEYMVMVGDIAIYIEAINAKLKGEKFVESIRDSVALEFIRVKDLLIHNYIDNVVDLVYDRLVQEYPDLEWDKPNVESVELVTTHLTQVGEDTAKVQISVEITMSLPITYDDYEFAFYDREDDRWYNVENYSTDIEMRLELDFSADFDYELDEEEIINFEVVALDDFKLWHYDEIGGE